MKYRTIGLCDPGSPPGRDSWPCLLAVTPRRNASSARLVGHGRGGPTTRHTGG